MASLRKLANIIGQHFDKWAFDVATFSILGLLFVPFLSGIIPTLILLIGLLLLIISQKTRNQWITLFKHSAFKMIVWPFIFWLLASTIISVIHINEYKFSFPSNALRIATATVLLCFAASTISEKIFSYGLISASVFSSIWGVWELFFQHERAQGTTNNAIHFGNLTAIVAMFCFSFVLLAQNTKKSHKLFFLLCMILSLFAAATSKTRSSAFIIICILPVLFINSESFLNKFFIKILSIATLSFIILLINSHDTRNFLRINEVVEELKSPATINYEKISGNRYEMWRAAWILFESNPLIGIGPGKYKENLESFIADGIVGPTTTHNQPHNDILHSASSGGIIKLLSYIGIILFPFLFFFNEFKKSRINKKSLLWPILGMQTVATFFLFGLTNSNFDLQVYSTTYGFLVCIIAKISSQNNLF